jgi:hypothetical protein
MTIYLCEEEKWMEWREKKKLKMRFGLRIQNNPRLGRLLGGTARQEGMKVLTRLTVF